MKKIFVLSILSVFVLNQFAVASTSNNSIISKLVKTQIKARFLSLDDNEKQKIQEAVSEGYEKLEVQIMSMTDEYVLTQLNMAYLEVKNSNVETEASEIFNKLTEDDKSNILISISEEDFLISSSSEEALKKNISEELYKSKFELGLSLKTLSKDRILKIIKAEKEKNKISQFNLAVLISGLVLAALTIAIGIGAVFAGLAAETAAYAAGATYVGSSILTIVGGPLIALGIGLAIASGSVALFSYDRY